MAGHYGVATDSPCGHSRHYLMYFTLNDGLDTRKIGHDETSDPAKKPIIIAAMMVYIFILNWVG